MQEGFSEQEQFVWLESSLPTTRFDQYEGDTRTAVHVNQIEVSCTRSAEYRLSIDFGSEMCMAALAMIWSGATILLPPPPSDAEQGFLDLSFTENKQALCTRFASVKATHSNSRQYF